MTKKYWWFETEWHQKMVKALQIAGMEERGTLFTLLTKFAVSCFLL